MEVSNNTLGGPLGQGQRVFLTHIILLSENISKSFAQSIKSCSSFTKRVFLISKCSFLNLYYNWLAGVDKQVRYWKYPTEKKFQSLCQMQQSCKYRWKSHEHITTRHVTAQRYGGAPDQNLFLSVFFWFDILIRMFRDYIQIKWKLKNVSTLPLILALYLSQLNQHYRPIKDTSVSG